VNSRLTCHAQPAAGGSSPAANRLIAIATLNGAKNMVPWFITQNGVIREARFKRNPDGTNDGGVHDLFVTTGRSDATGCNISQPIFTRRETRSPARRQLEHHLPDPNAGLWRWTHRSHSRIGDPGQHDG
jgi:hypothetical protein